MTALAAARAARRRAQDNLVATVRALYRPGASITWRHNGADQAGAVVAHGDADQLLVANARTGARYWIASDRILGH